MKTLFRKVAGNGPLGCPRCGWEGTVKLEPKEILCEDVQWFGVPHIRANCMGPCKFSNLNMEFLNGTEFINQLVDC
jgi:hypothetical protein